MDYEIKNVSLTSVLKVSFLVLLTVIVILVFFLHLFTLWIMGFLGSKITELSTIELPELNLSLSEIFAVSIISGLTGTIVVVFLFLLAVVFYNLYSKLVGGIHITIERGTGSKIDVNE